MKESGEAVGEELDVAEREERRIEVELSQEIIGTSEYSKFEFEAINAGVERRNREAKIGCSPVLWNGVKLKGVIRVISLLRGVVFPGEIFLPFMCIADCNIDIIEKPGKG